jgi:hypothetical protein
LKSLLILAAALLAVAAGAWSYSEYVQRPRDPSPYQLTILTERFPEIECAGAEFEFLGKEEALSDYYYEFKMTGSAACVRSLRSALIRRGYRDCRGECTHSGFQLAYDYSRENQRFKFGADGKSVNWVRDKT